MMNKWVERYIYAVSKRLPVSMREDVSKELRANIQDMIADEPLKEEDISEILHKLGHPNQLANSYRGKERYVIAPEHYDNYISALKLFGIIFVIVAFSTIPSSAFTEGWRTVAKAIVSSLTSGFLNTFTWITIGFWIVGTFDKNEPSETWKLKDLPELPKPNQSKISRGETIFELIFGLSFGLIFINWIQNGVPFLNMEIVQPFIIFFYISILMELIVGISKLIYGTWCLPIVFGSIIQKIYDAGFAYFLLKSDFLNHEIYTVIASNTEYSLQNIIDNIALSKEVLIWIVLLGTSISVITTLYKGLKAQH
jgi:hypothetical protein